MTKPDKRGEQNTMKYAVIKVILKDTFVSYIERIGANE